MDVSLKAMAIANFNEHATQVFRLTDEKQTGTSNVFFRQYVEVRRAAFAEPDLLHLDYTNKKNPAVQLRTRG